MSQIVLGVGSNIERNQHVSMALDRLQAQWGDLIISPVYESPGNIASSTTDISFYYNLVVIFQTDMDALKIKKILKKIEDDLGRERDSDNVAIDLDILLIDNWTGELDGGTVPHADIERCPYVLRPLADLLPDMEHPLSKKKFSELWRESHSEKNLTPIDFVWHDKVLSVSACLPIV